MSSSKPRYFHDVDDLMARTPTNAVLAHFGRPLADRETGEHRLNCVFNEQCQTREYAQLTIRLDDPARRIFCHSCRVSGNLLTLIHGLENGRPPTGGKLRGDEFKAAVATLRAINAQPVSSSPPVDQSPAPEAKAQPPESRSPAVERNVPLRRHEKEAARKLVDLFEDLIVDPADMPPNAAAYVRSRPWLTPDVAREWEVGYLPRDGRSLFRGWIVYTQRDERGEVISYYGRDVNYDDKYQKWIASGHPDGKKPNKHKYVSGYRRGLELYGQSAVRLTQESVRESLESIGLVIVEGANDVIRLDTLGIAAVGLGSNRATRDQTNKIVRFATSAANGRAVLMPDCDEDGEDGFRELLWTLNTQGIDVRLGWSREMHGGQFDGEQPEHLTPAACEEVILPFLRGTD